MDEDLAFIMREFTLIRRHFWVTFTMKFSFWGQLPWHLFGIAHHITGTARRCAQRCLALRDASAAVADDHWVTVLLLVFAQGREQLIVFANSFTLLNELPFLERMAARFRLALSSERFVESLHALTKQAISSAHHQGPVNVTYHAMLRSVRVMLRDKPDALHVLAAAARSTRNIWCCICQAGLEKHETCVELQGQANGRKHLNRECRRQLVEILFHCDVRTLHKHLAPPYVGYRHLAMPDLPSHHPGGGGPPPPPPPPPHHPGGGGPPPPPPHHPGGGAPGEEGGDAGSGDASGDDSPGGGGGGPGGGGSSSSHGHGAGGPSGAAGPGGSGSTGGANGGGGAFDGSGGEADEDAPDGGKVYDTLWRQSAFQYLKVQSQSDETTTAHKVYFIRTAMPVGSLMNMQQSLADAYNPTPQDVQYRVPDSTVETDALFDIQEYPLAAEAVLAPDTTSLVEQKKASSRLVFSIYTKSPSLQKTLTGAPRVTESKAIVAILHELAEYDPIGQTIRVLNPDQEIAFDKHCLLFTPKTFTRKELARCISFDRAPKLHYDIGEGLPWYINSEVLSSTIAALLPSASSVREGHGDPYVLMSDADKDGDIQRSLELLLSLEYAERLDNSESSSAWGMTPAGKRSFRMSDTLINPERSLAPQPDTPRSEMYAIELLFLMEQENWLCKTWYGGPRPEPYVSGGEKVWWLSWRAKSFKALYFQVLLKYSSIDPAKNPLPIKHMVSGDAYYTARLEGRVYQPNSKRHQKNRYAFDVDAVTHHDLLPPKPDSKPAPKRKVRAKQAVKKMAEVTSSSSNEASSSISMSELSDDTKESVKSTGSSSDTSSSASKSASPSSSASSDKAGSPRKRRVADEMNVSQCAERKQFDVADNFTWRGARFTHYFRDAIGLDDDEPDTRQAIGTEVTCPFHKKCKRRLAFSKHGGKELVEVLLKQWMLKSPSVLNKVDHRDMSKSLDANVQNIDLDKQPFAEPPPQPQPQPQQHCVKRKRCKGKQPRLA